MSLMIANNETGVLQPILPAAALCRSAGIPIHADGVQALGKGPLSFKALGVDALTLSAHKIHGPVGIGALILRHPFKLTPQMWGGFQQFGMRPGSEPVALAVGFAEAVQQAFASRAQRVASMETHRDRFESALQSQLPWIHILGKEVARLPNTSSVVFPGCDRQSLQMAFDLRGLACSTGSACASGSSQPSHVLQAMGLPEAWVQGGLRFSNSFETTEEEVDRAVQIIVETTRHLHQG